MLLRSATTLQCSSICTCPRVPEAERSQAVQSARLLQHCGGLNSNYYFYHLQLMSNAAAKTVADNTCLEKIDLTLAGLPWLRASGRVVFKLVVLVDQLLHGTAPR